jgi:hypothetical protein
VKALHLALVEDLGKLLVLRGALLFQSGCHRGRVEVAALATATSGATLAASSSPGASSTTAAGSAVTATASSTSCTALAATSAAPRATLAALRAKGLELGLLFFRNVEVFLDVGPQGKLKLALAERAAAAKSLTEASTTTLAAAWATTAATLGKYDRGAKGQRRDKKETTLHNRHNEPSENMFSFYFLRSDILRIAWSLFSCSPSPHRFPNKRSRPDHLLCRPKSSKRSSSAASSKTGSGST